MTQKHNIANKKSNIAHFLSSNYMDIFLEKKQPISQSVIQTEVERSEEVLFLRNFRYNHRV